MTQRFQKAYDALVKSYFEGTLAKGNCFACAVGNIVADAQGGKITRSLDSHGDTRFACTTRSSFWSACFITFEDAGQWKPTLRNHVIEEAAAELLKLTGYNEDELAEVEAAFECSTKIQGQEYHLHSEQEILEDQYNGLCAVFEVMCKLDGVEVDYKTKLQEKEGLILA